MSAFLRFLNSSILRASRVLVCCSSALTSSCSWAWSLCARISCRTALMLASISVSDLVRSSENLDLAASCCWCTWAIWSSSCFWTTVIWLRNLDKIYYETKLIKIWKTHRFGHTLSRLMSDVFLSCASSDIFFACSSSKANSSSLLRSCKQNIKLGFN